MTDFRQRRRLEAVRLELAPSDLDQFGAFRQIVVAAFFERGLPALRNVARDYHSSTRIDLRLR